MYPFSSEAAMEAVWRDRCLSRELREQIEIWSTRPGEASGGGAGGRARGGSHAEPANPALPLCRAEMVHYLDVRDGWELAESDSRFDRAVSCRAQRALNMMTLADFRFHLHNQLPASVPKAPPNRLSGRILEYSARVPGGPMRGAPPNVQFQWKCMRAPYLCAEGMVIEWFSEPRVGVLLDLGIVRSRLPALLAATAPNASPARSPPPPAAAAAVAADAAAAAASTAFACCWRCRSCWAAYRRAVAFATFLALVSRSPRVVTLWLTQGESYKVALPALMAALGAGRQAEADCFGSALTQVLGVKDKGELKEGFGFYMQHLLSGAVENAHAEGRGRAGGAGGAGRTGGGGRGGAGQTGGGGGRPDPFSFNGMMAGMMRLMVNDGRLGDAEERRRMYGDPGLMPLGDMMSMLEEPGVTQRLADLLDAESEGGGSDGGAGGGGEGGDGGGEGEEGRGNGSLKGPEWERYVDGMGWILQHGGGEGTEFKCNHCSNNGRGNSSSSRGGSSSSIPKGMFVSGMGGTDFALAVATVFSQPDHCTEVQVFCLDGNNASKTRVEEAAIEEARARLSEGGTAGGGAGAAAAAVSCVTDAAAASAETTAAAAAAAAGGSASSSDVTAVSAVSERASSGMFASAATASTMPANTVPVNTNQVVAAFAYRAGRILQWARIYGSDFISGKDCFKGSPQGKFLPMRHPLRDLPSLLVRLGAIPKPLENAGNPLEWEEWPQGDEAAEKLPEDPSARCFRLGIVEESGTTEEGGENTSNQAARANGRGRAGRGQGGREAGRKRGSVRESGREEGPPSLINALTAAIAPQNKKLPILRCTADVDLVVEFAGHMVDPPACAQCNSCFAKYTFFLPALALIANFAYRPASVLFNRFVSVFPPHSAEFRELVDLLYLEPFPTDVPALLNLHVVRDRVEQLPVLFLLRVALHWPKSLLQIGELEGVGADEGSRGARGAAGRRVEKKGRKGGKGGKGRGGGGGGAEEEEDDGEVWEEVRAWCIAAMVGWKASLRVVGPGLSDTCQGKKGRGKREGKAEMARLTAELWKRATESRYCDELQDQERSDSSCSSSGGGGSGSSGSSGSSSNGSCSSEASSKKGEVPAYMKPWPGGVNLVTCLREMLLGQPCYRPAPQAAPPNPAVSAKASSMPSIATNGGAAAVPSAKKRASAPDEGRMCGSEGCGQVEGGGVKLKNCSGCGQVAYCNRDCQKAHWPSHKLTCKRNSSSKENV